MSATIPSTDPQILMVSVDPNFRPWYTPNEMFRLGVYGGWFFSKASTRYQYLDSVPKDAFNGVDTTRYLQATPDNSINHFGVLGFSVYTDRWFQMSLQYKRLHMGWFDWYCRYAYGVFSLADKVRMDQWRKLVAVEAFYIQNGVYVGESDAWTDLTFKTNRKQKLLELGWDPTKNPANYGLAVNF